MESMELIEIQRSDADRLAPLVAAFRVTLNGYRGIVSAPKIEAAREEIVEFLDAGMPVFAVEAEGELAGYTVCRIDEPCLWVEHLYVRDEHRRRGVATLLFEKAEELARAMGEDTVFNFVHPNNRGMIEFLRAKRYTVLNMIEIRKPYPGERSPPPSPWGTPFSITEGVGMKIHIVGGPGSGKSFLAKKLSRELGIPHYDLDDIQWVNEGGYGTKRDITERDALLRQILQKDQWIIEGVYYAWCGRCFEDADRIYLLTVPRRVYRYRILRRFLRRKLGLEPGKKETLSSLSALLKWADKYQRVNLAEIRKLLEAYPEKVMELSEKVGE